MAYNAVIEANFSETQTAGSDAGNASVSGYTGTGGEWTYNKTALIDSEPLLAFRGGIQWDIIDTDAIFGSGREVKIDTETGDVTWNTNLAAFDANETAQILYLPNGGDADITEPVTLQQAKDWLKVESDADDDLITDLIAAARLHCEKYANKSLVQRTITAVVCNELGGVFLPYGPHGSIVSAADAAGNDVTLTTRGDQFKQIMEPCSDYLKIVYTAGYPVCPSLYKKAIKNALMYMYQNRGDAALSGDIGSEAMTTLSPFRDVV